MLVKPPTQNQQIQPQDYWATALGRQPTSLSSITSRLSTLALTAFALYSIANIQGAEAGPLAYAACCIACTGAGPASFFCWAIACGAALVAPGP